MPSRPTPLRFGAAAIAVACTIVACGGTPTDLCACTFAAADIAVQAQVLDSGRRPVAGARVRFEGESLIAGRRTYTVVSSPATSDSLGRLAATIRVLYGTTPLRAAIVVPGRADTVRTALGVLAVSGAAVPSGLQYTLVVP